MRKKYMTRLGLVALLVGGALSCKDEFLDTRPFGAVTETTLSSNESGADALLIAAYSNLDGYSGWENGTPWGGAASNWTFGSIAGGDAYKGSEANDQPDVTPIERHETTPNNPYVDGKWRNYYDGIARCNKAIKAFSALDIPDARKNLRLAEARFLRGLYHLELRKVFGKVPFITEDLEDVRVGNETDPLPKIQADFQFAVDNLQLSGDQGDIGRATKGAAQSYLGYTYLLEAKYPQAKALFDAVISSGKYALNAKFQDNFNAEFRNSTESILEVQQAVNVGTDDNSNNGDVLNYPYGGGPGGCCGFHQPSQNLVNAFQTDVNGLPLLDSYNNALAFTPDQGIPSSSEWDIDGEYEEGAAVSYYFPAEPNREHVYMNLVKKPAKNIGNNPTSSGKWGIPKDFYGAGNPAADVPNEPVWIENSDVSLDPRLDWTVGRRGIPYLDWGPHPGRAWIRDQLYGGVYTPLKNVYYKSQEDVLTTKSGWTKGYNANNTKLLRYSDLLLMAAEAEIEAGSLTTALNYVNQIRTRAANPAGRVLNEDGTPAANYNAGTYASFADAAFARKAVRFERRLELAMEGHRFFDLVRWGIAEQEKDAYFAKEKTLRTYLSGADFESTDVVFPIPQKAITQSSVNGTPTIKQNDGY